MQRVISVLWPSFVMAGLAAMVFFAIFDPFTLMAPTWFPNLSRLAAYGVGFFMFWALTASSCLLTCFFQRPLRNLNRHKKKSLSKRR
ncbi:MAG: hypothetical protein HN428_08395 [Proteobacteria bacterium]|nr:hypothetical protein [Pseudomonadota bacterium]MBT5227876.1 hypothetical protein [Pseudomonadota bacterium]MBT5817452.1 hypothetical protein [Pseudomonadota bacterium]MBT6348481.1 hypothetical protein [Pseudomonadota bacterium]